jgi:hypothetical protein
MLLEFGTVALSMQLRRNPPYRAARLDEGDHWAF